MKAGGNGKIWSRHPPKSRVQLRTSPETSTPPRSKRRGPLKNANSSLHFVAPSKRKDINSVLKQRFSKIAGYFIRRNIKGRRRFELAARLNRGPLRLTAGLLRLKMSGKKYFGKIAPLKSGLPLTLGAGMILKY